MTNRENSRIADHRLRTNYLLIDLVTDIWSIFSAARKIVFPKSHMRLRNGRPEAMFKKRDEPHTELES